MKIKMMTLMAAALVCSAIFANAQIADESRVKLLYAGKPGSIRLIHAIPTDEPITVKFLDSDGNVAATDKIEGTYPKGISKVYDASKLGRALYRMEVSTSALSVTYRIKPSSDGKRFSYRMEKAIHHYDQVLTAKN